MRADELSFKDKSPCGIKNVPAPEMLGCPVCCAEIELWSDEQDAVCGGCGASVFRE